MSLILNEISFTYAAGEPFAQSALDRVSFSVEPGEVVLVAGPTGSGKSTLLRIAAGLLAPSAGRAQIDGRALNPESARGQVGLVFQSPEQQLFADTVIDDVMFGPRNLGIPAIDARLAAEEALESVGLEPADFAARSPFSLSGGEARRAAIAGVLAMGPAYLLLDEPTAGLDARGRLRLLEVVSRVREASGIVIVSHDLDELMPLADRLLLLEGGSARFWGAANSTYEDVSVFASAGLSPPSVLAVFAGLDAAGVSAGRPSLDLEIASERIAGSHVRDGVGGHR